MPLLGHYNPLFGRVFLNLRADITHLRPASRHLGPCLADSLPYILLLGPRDTHLGHEQPSLRSNTLASQPNKVCLGLGNEVIVLSLYKTTQRKRNEEPKISIWAAIY